jgi:hypothetical protein
LDAKQKARVSVKTVSDTAFVVANGRYLGQDYREIGRRILGENLLYEIQVRLLASIRGVERRFSVDQCGAHINHRSELLVSRCRC